MEERLKKGKEVLHSFDLLLSPSHDLLDRFPYPIKGLHHQLPLLRSIPWTPKPNGRIRFLYASTIIPTKGLHLLLDAMEKLPNAELWVAGHHAMVDYWPNYFEEQKKRCESMDNIRFLGPYPHTKIPDLLAQSHCLVLPSLWPENSPIIIREALAAGLHVITSDQGGSKELSPNIHTFSPQKENELLEKMRSLTLFDSRNPPHPHQDIANHCQFLEKLYFNKKLALK